GDFLVVSTSDGVVTYNGRNWRSFTVENGLPSGNILSLYSTGSSVLIGTDSGIVRYSGLDFVPIAGSEQLPKGPVTAMGAQGLNNIWIVLNNDLYHFDGTVWSNTAPYAVAIDDTPETIASRFSLRGTADETKKFIARFEALNRRTMPLPVPVDSSGADVLPTPVDSVPAVENTTDGVAPADTEETNLGPDEALTAETESVDSALTAAEETGPSDISGAPLVLSPGTVVQVPYVAEIRGAVHSIYTDLSGNVWLGTDNGVLVYDGSGWKSHGTGTANRLTSISSGSSPRLFAFGDGGTMLRYDDPSWSGIPLDTATLFNDVWGGPGGDLVAVNPGGGIMRYDGDNWSEMTSGNTSELFAVWGTSDSNIFAVGADGTILRYDGTAWAAMNSGTAVNLYGIWGEPARGMIAVGAGGIILSYDGANWNSLSSGTTADLYAVWGGSFNDVYAVGDGGLVLHWNGAAWTTMPSGTEQTLRSVWGSSANHVVAVGDDETIVEYDGTLWKAIPRESSLDLYDVWGRSAQDVFAVGEHGTILHYDGKQWRLQSSGRRVNNIDARSDRVYLATDGGVVEYDGREWRRVEVGGMERTNTLSVMVIDGELWLANDRKVVTGVSGQKELAFMHVKWLPELADDLYYEFLSFVNDFKGWGTLGGNVTFISYGTFSRTAEDSPEVVGEFDSFDIAFTLSYGTSLTRKLKGGVSAKFIYSRLADLGAGEELGQGTSSGFAVDFGLLYKMTDRLNWGLAITNIGPKMAYIDAAQADDLPRNFAFGFAYKLFRSDYYHVLVTSEINKILVGLDDGFSEELKQLIINSGVEFLYADIFALRSGYIYDEEGNVKTLTLGVGLTLLSKFKFDFAYIPSNSSSALANTLRVSIAVIP
ncbi:MAG: PorV/PorQ family protein, partial [candidate division Zixibacteria bacterium]|nr:PorV/PorQ family protein [candidate division Zixibacteria bacterium]